MNFEGIANEVIDELVDTYEYDGLGAISYYQMVHDLANYAFREWDLALFVAFEDAVEAELRRRGHVPID